MKTIGSSILEMNKRNPSKPAIQYKLNNSWKSISWQNYHSDIEKMGAGLIHIGLKPGDRVALMSHTRYEWGLMDLAILGSQGVTVPIYQNILGEDVAFIINNSESTILILENKKLFDLWNHIKDQCPSIKNIFVIDPLDVELTETICSLEKLKSLGADLLESDSFCFKKRCDLLQSSDTASLVYTSGTTGRPKGVVLTHLQITSEVTESIPICGVSEDDTSLAFLPFAHVMGRVELWSHATIGFTMAYAENLDKLRQNLEEIAPTFIVAVPRIFEKIYASIMGEIGNHHIKQSLFNWALKIGRHISHLRQNRQIIPLEALSKYFIAKKLVLNKVNDAFGGKIKFAICGGAPLSREISTFFHAAGLHILEGYGLTETTAAVCVNTPYNYQFGTVGCPAGDVQLKIAEDGEILIKSHKVMKEYYKDPISTAETIKNGWFHTGDIGEITENGYLRITDRKKDLIKTAGGKYVAPQKIEELLKLNPLINNILVHGDERKYIVALLTINRQNAVKWAKSRHIQHQNWEELTHHPDFIAAVRSSIAETNKNLASWETIKKYLVLPGEFTIEGGELTPSLKVKRKVLEKRYKKEIDSLY